MINIDGTEHGKTSPNLEYSNKNIFKDARTQETSRALIQSLTAHGVKTAFGISGGAIALPYLRLTEQTAIEVHHCKDERSACYMAIGRGMLTRKREIPLVFATAGPGITNLATGIATAYEEKIPLFILTGNISTELKDRGAAQDSFQSGISALQILDPLCAASITIENADDLLPAVAALMQTARQTSLPVHLNLPTNVASALISPPRDMEVLAPLSRVSPLTSSAWETTWHSFHHCQKPLVFAGNGIKTSGLRNELIAFAERRCLPVLVTPHGRGAFPEDHPLFAGLFGFAAPATGMEYLTQNEPDGILFLGTRLGETASAGWSPLLGKPAVRIHVDHDSRQAHRIYPMSHFLPMELDDFFERAALQSAPLHRPSPLPKRTPPPFSAFEKNVGTLAHPRTLMTALAHHMPPSTRLFSDIGNGMAWAIHHLPLRGQQEFFVPMALGAMGSGIGTALGAATLKQFPVLVLAGDAATLMGGNEIHTAVEHQIPLKMIVLNDGGHGMVDHGFALLGIQGKGLRFNQPVDFSLWGKSLGLKTFLISNDDQLKNLDWNAFFSSPDPQLIDLRIDPRITPPIHGRTNVLQNHQSLKGTST